MTVYRRLLVLALALACIVVVFGAYVRLSDAGLGCPDWPGCYGQISPHHAADEIHASHSANPTGPVSAPKAWKEMIHRYLAASLGLLIIAIAVQARRCRTHPGVAWRVAVALLGLVLVQGLLGKWTVTLLLKPAIVTAHLLGGLATLALLAWLTLRACGAVRHESSRRMVGLARFAFVLLVGQVVLGGWTSTNYAALACTDFPTCQGSLWPTADYANAFHVVRELGMTADGQSLPLAALTAIHWAHRLGALLAGAVLLALFWTLSRRQATQAAGLVLLGALSLQIGLGIANVAFGLPLVLAVAHNAGAAALVLVLVWINYRLRAAQAPAGAGRRRDRYAGRENAFA